MTPVPISVCIISGAEAKRIGRTLASVAGWAAEVNVVLNEEVIDGTEEICRQHGARVFREPWKGYAGQKNSAAAKATQPWILSLDADEVVTPELRDEIIRTFGDVTLSTRCAGFSLPRLSFYAGRWIRHGDRYPDRKTRLWKRGEGRWADALTKVFFASTGPAQLPDGITALVTDRDGRVSILGPWPAGLELAA